MVELQLKSSSLNFVFPLLVLGSDWVVCGEADAFLIDLMSTCLECLGRTNMDLNVLERLESLERMAF